MPSTNSATANLFKYAESVRSHAVPNFPDPNSHGQLLIDPSSDIDPNSPQYQSAQEACAKTRAAALSSGMTPAQHVIAPAQFTRFTSCTRDHCIPMADPINSPNGVGYAVPPAIDPTSLTYRQAEAACKHFLPNG